jgi:vanillate O-demethylase ferredoxin subunit
MAYRLHALGADFELHYCVRNRARAAFFEELAASPFADRVHLHLDDGPDEQRLDLDHLLVACGRSTHVYCCGPEGFLAHVKGRIEAAGWPESAFHVEYFSASTDLSGGAFTVIAERSGRSFEVPPGRSILEVLAEAGIEVETSCQSGLCGSCLTEVLEGVPDHRDHVQTSDEKAANRRIAVCCSRSLSRRLVLDI